MSEKDTHIHRPDGLLFKGEVKGHINEQNKIREKDGIIFKGEEIGYIDKENNIREKDGWIFKGDIIGEVKQNIAKEKDGWIFSGEEWGYVDEEGNIRIRDGFFKGRIVGKMRGNNVAGALGHFVLMFKKIEDNITNIEDQINRTQDITVFYNRVTHFIEYLNTAEALGDYDNATRRLKLLVERIEKQFYDNLTRKKECIGLLRKLRNEMEKKESVDELKRIQNAWKEIKSAGKDRDDNLWHEYKEALNACYDQRKAYFAQKDEENKQNIKRKRELILTVKELSWDNIKESINRIKLIQAEWKTVGPVRKEENQQLNQEFFQLCSSFFDHYRKKREDDQRRWEERNRAYESNMAGKEELCRRAEALRSTTDLIAVKELQSEWKTIGSVKKEVNEALWQRFSGACNQVYQNASRERQIKQAEWEMRQQEREQKQREWFKHLNEILSQKKEQADRLYDSIKHDEDNIDRWEDQLGNIREGRRADEIRESIEAKIDSVREKIRSKENKLNDLQDAIRDLESKCGN